MDALERLERAATHGPWVSTVEGRDHYGGPNFIVPPGDWDPDVRVEIRVDSEFHPWSVADQDFIAAARNAIPLLIAEIRRLRAASAD